MAKTLYTQCPQCKGVVTVNEGIWGSLKKTNCVHCGTMFDPKRNRISTGRCERCNKDIPFDQFAKGEKVCPFCGEMLQTGLNRVEMRKVICPYCRGAMYIDGSMTSGIVCCEHCNETFDVANSIRKVQNAQNQSDIIINHKGMERDQVLWRHPKGVFSADSQIVMDAGMVALVVSGSECRALVQRSGMSLREALGSSCNIEYVNVVFMRLNLNNPILFGGALRQLQDTKYRFKSSSAVGYNGILYVYIENAEVFAQKVNFMLCTEDELGLRTPDSVVPTSNLKVMGVPQIRLANNDYMVNACKQTMDQNGCSLLELSTYRQQIRNNFVALAQDELLQDWGLAISRCELNGMEIRRDMLEAVDNIVLVNRVCQEIHWQPFEVNVHLKERNECNASVSVSGMAQLRVANLLRLQRHSDSYAWETSSDDNIASNQIAQWIVGNMSNILSVKLQQCINESNMEDIRDLSCYERGIIDEIQDAFNNDSVYAYLYEHGLEMEALMIQLEVRRLSEPLRRMYEIRNLRSIKQFEVDEEQITNDARAAITRQTARRIAESTIYTEDTEERVELARYEREQRRRAREHERSMQNSHYLYEEELQDKRQQEESQRLSDQVRMDSAIRDAEFQRFNDDLEQEREVRANQHNLALTEIMNSIERSKLSFREKLDAYSRVKQMQDALSDADIKRTEAIDMADIKRIAIENELKLSQEAQKLIDEAAQAEQELEERKKNAELERVLTVRRQELEAEMERVRMQEAVRERERQTEESQLEMKLEIERLGILVNCYEKQFQSEVDVARATAAAEEARRDARKEFDRRQQEQKKRDQADKDKARRQEAERAEKDRRHLENMLADMKKLQNEINNSVKEAGKCEDVDAGKIEDLARSIDDMFRQLSNDIKLGVGKRQENHRRDVGEVRLESDCGGDRRRQPGVRRDDVCYNCGEVIRLDAAYCAACGVRILR